MVSFSDKSVLLLVVLLLSFSSRSTQTTYYVTPTPTTPCPGEPCHTLNRYVDHYFKNLSSNTTLVFLPGDHTLNHTISMGTASNQSGYASEHRPEYYYPYPSLTLLGSSSSIPAVTSRIICTHSGAIALSGIANLNISGLTFISLYRHDHTTFAAIILRSVGHSRISNCSFQNKILTAGNNFEYGGAIHVLNSVVSLTQSVFQDNSAYYGGALYAHGNSRLIIANNTFLNNSAKRGGGAIYIRNSIAILAENTFQNNSAIEGGSLNIRYSTLTLTRNTLLSSTAVKGGALHDRNSSITITENTFWNNSAKYGGVLHVTYTTMIIANNTFQENSASAGCFYIEKSTLSFGENIFQHNSAKHGGVLCGKKSTLTLTKNTFDSNFASLNGGVLYVYRDNILILTRNIFHSNSAISGGICYANMDNTLILTENTFQNNFATNGGVCFIRDSILALTANTLWNNTADYGGALDIRSSTLTLTRNVFERNSAHFMGGSLQSVNSILNLTKNVFQSDIARSYGGDFYIILNSTLYLTENILQNSSADYGGAIYASSSTLSITGNDFQSSSANHDGGAMHSRNSNLTLIGNTFQKNSANNRGAALDVYLYSIITLENNTFKTNSAAHGGALAVYSHSNLTLKGNKFRSNIAEHQGGALYIDAHCNLTITGNVFENNSADTGSGGAVDVNRNCFLTTMENTFQNNSANTGGVFAVHSSTCDFRNDVFQHNYANSGGALNAKHSTLTLRENTFEANSANSTGGAVSMFHSTLKLTGNVFQNNSALNAGGALNANNSTLTLCKNTFETNSANIVGGAVNTIHSTLTLKGNVFQNNLALYDGGALKTNNSTLTLRENTFERNSANTVGGAVSTFQSTLTLTRNMFQNNSALYDGGALNTNNSTATFNENSFYDNLALFSGGALNNYNTTLNFINNIFQNNSALYYGGAVNDFKTTLTITDNTFQNNSAGYGGAVDAWNSQLTITANIFNGNSARHYGGAVEIWNSTFTFIGNVFQNNSAGDIGGGLVILASTTNFTNNSFTKNTAQKGGGIAASDCEMKVAGILTLESNYATIGGGLYADKLQMFHLSGNANFIDNSATESGGGAYVSRSVVSIEQMTSFIGNLAMNGGGLLLTDSNLYFQPTTTIHFTSNVARQNGGAIKVEESNPLNSCAELSCEFLTGSDCFFQIQTQRRYDDGTEISQINELENISLHFENNSAAVAGDALYGGSVDNCSLKLLHIQQWNFFPYRCFRSGDVFNHITNYMERLFDISSAPLQLCTCNGNEPACNVYSLTRSVYPGGRVNIPVIAYGQRNGKTPAVIHDITPTGMITIDDPENTQTTALSCTFLNYTVHTRAVGTTQELILYAEGPCPPRRRKSPVPTNTLKVYVDILQCPPGFELSKTRPACICAVRLQSFTNVSRIDDRTILRDSDFWAGYDSVSEGLILHPHCPFDYCTSDRKYIQVNASDSQCNYNRTGLLCGQCNENFSLALGSSHCLQCSHFSLSLLAAFAVAGVALVLFLLVLRLNVSSGTINGLIFYANILAVNTAFFQPRSTSILTIFISWINLDLGIETCFYNGMDAYVKAWLQFVFPFYVWVLVGIIILASHYSSKVSRILGSNPIAVLATLFLLSYAKLLRTIIAAFSYTLVEYPNNSHTAVWLYDGSIRYLSNEHIPLFIAAMVCLIFLFVPYTVFLLFGQWFRAKSGWKVFSWINNHRVLPFLEAYHAPYNDKHRYWTGLMLVVRCILFLVFAFNALGDPSINHFVIVLASTVLLVLIALLGNRIYKIWYLNILEMSFIANLCILATASLYIRLTGGNQSLATLTSISVAFTTFIGIVIYHLVHQIKYLCKRMFPQHDCPSQQENDSIHPQKACPETTLGRSPNATVTEISLHDLLHQELREPCLEFHV